jgi:hypothetical protein
MTTLQMISAALTGLIGFTPPLWAQNEVGVAPTAPAVTQPAISDPAVTEPAGSPVATFNISGQLMERGTNVLLKDVNVFLLPQKLKATTDNAGRFSFEGVAAGPIQLVVNLPGYKRLEKSTTTEAWNSAEVVLVEKENYMAFETTIVAQKQKRDQSRKSLTREEFLTVPGSSGDPVKAVQNLPGVNRVAGFSSNVVIQGSSPQDTTYDLEGHEIPIVFHFGGLTSVVMPEAIEAVDYLSAGYGPEYSRAMGGVISLKTRAAEVEDRKRKGFFFADTLKTGGLFETRVDEKSTLIVSGRYSYVGQFLKAATRGNEMLNLTVAPEFADLTLIYDRKQDHKNSFRLNFLASRDTLGFILKEPLRDDPAARGTFETETSFFRIVPQWTHKISETESVKLSMGTGQDLILLNFGDNFFRLKSWATTVRGEYDKKFSEFYQAVFGFDNQYTRANLDLRLPKLNDNGGVNDPVASSTTREVSLTAKVVNLGIYVRNELKFDQGISVMPNLRVDRFSQTKEVVVSPRLATQWQYADDLLLKAATGLYDQPPQPQEANDSFGNPDVKAPSAIHATIGFDKDFRAGRSDGYQWSSSFFHRDFRKLVVSSSAVVDRGGIQVPEVYNNSGAGRAQGIETQVKFTRAPWSGWISYTVSQSQRWDPFNPVYNYEFDQTHNLNVVGSYDYGNNWKFAGRFRYVTGNPLTPVTGGTFDTDNDVFVPTRGGFYSTRQNDFVQLDFRMDKKWIYDHSIWSLYLDIQNVLNTKNTESVRYSYDYSQRQDVTGLPILPALGVKGEF